MMPLFTSMRSNSSTPGIASGVPLPSGSLRLMSPTRKSVCVHVLPCAPMCAAVPAYRPPPSMRFDTNSGWIVSSTEYRLPLDGRSISTQAGVVVSTAAGGDPLVRAGAGGAGTD